MATNSETESETNAELDVLTLMREKLPRYVINCLLASGFDVADVIMSMDVSEQPGNSIETIENYINDHYAGHEDYCNTPVSSCSVTPFVFPPGHRLRIRNFVLELRKNCIIQMWVLSLWIQNRKNVESQVLLPSLRNLSSALIVILTVNLFFQYHSK